MIGHPWRQRGKKSPRALALARQVRAEIAARKVGVAFCRWWPGEGCSCTADARRQKPDLLLIIGRDGLISPG